MDNVGFSMQLEKRQLIYVRHLYTYNDIMHQIILIALNCLKSHFRPRGGMQPTQNFSKLCCATFLTYSPKSMQSELVLITLTQVESIGIRLSNSVTLVVAST